MNRTNTSTSSSTIQLDADISCFTQNMALLHDFLGSLRAPGGYPPARIQPLRFVVHRGEQLSQVRQATAAAPFNLCLHLLHSCLHLCLPNAFQKVRAVLKTTGGDCSRLVARTLTQLLESVGVDPRMDWCVSPRLKPASKPACTPLNAPRG